MTEAPLVAHVIYALSTGGLENGLVNILNRFPVQRYRHVIICLTSADDFASRISAPNIDLLELNMAEGHDWRCYIRLWRLLRELRPQIVHSRNLAALEAQICTLGLRGVRRVHGEHGREIGDLDGTNPRYLALRRFMRRFIDRYVAVSKDLERWLLETVEASPERVIQIYNGVDHERFRPGSVKPLALLPDSWRHLDDIVVIGTVGRLSPVKDHGTLLRAIAAVRETDNATFAKMRVLIVGDGPLMEELRSTAEQLAIEDSVYFAGDRSDVPELLRLMDVFVLPSLAEGISNTVLEAMAAGLPVLATAAGGNLELVESGENGDLFPVGDSERLAALLAEYASMPDRRARCGAKARVFVQRQFDWNTTVQSYVEVYDGLARGQVRG